MSLSVLEHLGPKSKELVKGVVIDSAPPMSDIYAFGGYVAHVTKKPSLKTLYSQPFRFFRYYQGIDKKFEDETKLKMRRLFDPSQHIVFLCSEDDPVLCKDYVLQYYEDLKNLGVNVNLRMWEKARHSLAIMDHPEEYNFHVEKLIRDSNFNINKT